MKFLIYIPVIYIQVKLCLCVHPSIIPVIKYLFIYRLRYQASASQVAFCIVTLETVLVRTGHCLPWQRPDVLPLPAAVCLCTVDGFQASTSKGPSLLGAPAVFLGVHHSVRGDSRGIHYPS